MDFYALFKFLHVSSAIVWIGAGLCMVILGVAARRANDRDAYIRVVQQVIFLAPRVFMPSSIAAFVFGMIVASMGWNFTLLWLWLGLAGFIATFVTGSFLIKPRADAVARLLADGNGDRASIVGNELLAIAQFDYLVLFTVVADMIFKPQGFGDWPLLLVFVIVLAAGGYFFLTPVLRSAGPAVRAAS